MKTWHKIYPRFFIVWSNYWGIFYWYMTNSYCIILRRQTLTNWMYRRVSKIWLEIQCTWCVFWMELPSLTASITDVQEMKDIRETTDVVLLQIVLTFVLDITKTLQIDKLPTYIQNADADFLCSMRKIRFIKQRSMQLFSANNNIWTRMNAKIWLFP